MNKDELLEEYRKIKLKEELDKAMWNKYKPMRAKFDLRHRLRGIQSDL